MENHKNKKALLVSLAFPPLPVVGSIRVAKFCKYLQNTTWQPLALTEKIRDVKAEKDWTALKDVGDDIIIRRTLNIQPFYWWDNRHQDSKSTQPIQPKVDAPTQEPISQSGPSTISSIKGSIKKALMLIRKTLSVPDARLAWVPQALIPGLRLIRKEKIDIIFSTSPPATNHILGYFLSVLSGKPHVVEFRDLWTLTGAYFFRDIPTFLRKYDTFWERKILKHCKGIVVVTKTFMEKQKEGFPFLSNKKFTVIYNGIDKKDFENLPWPTVKNDQFVISYFGNLYGFRDPTLFFKALGKWLSANPMIKEKIRIDFWGSESLSGSSGTAPDSLKPLLHFHSRIPYEEIIPKMIQSDLLLLIQGIDIRVADSIPTKMFEYMATGKPILAFFPEGEAREILTGHPDTLIISSDDIDDMVTFLQARYKTWEDQADSIVSHPTISPEFSRENQAKKLASFFDDIVE